MKYAGNREKISNFNPFFKKLNISIECLWFLKYGIITFLKCYQIKYRLYDYISHDLDLNQEFVSFSNIISIKKLRIGKKICKLHHL